MARQPKQHFWLLLLFILIAAVYLVLLIGFSSSVLRFADAGNNIRFAVALLLCPIPLYLISLLFRKEIQTAILFLAGMVWTGAAGLALALGFIHFATLDEVCFNEEVLRIPMNRTEIVITWRTCTGPEYARLGVVHERRLFGGLRIRKKIYDREIGEHLDGLGAWRADILVRSPRAVLVPIEEGKNIFVEVIPPDRVMINDGKVTETILATEFVYF